MGQKYVFGDKVEELIDLLEDMTGQLMRNDMDGFEANIPELSVLLEICIPQIIITYSDPSLKELASDATYWSNQLGRIIEALNQKDKFVRMDVLYQETRTNLLGFNKMIKGTYLADVMVESA